MAHTNTTWLSDEVRPKPSLQLAYGCTLEFTPGVCNHWMVGDTTDGDVYPADTKDWWDFMLRVPMNGQLGISSKVFEWPAGLVEHAASNVALYKRIRSTIAQADVYHLTEQPAHNNPKGWMAIQYVTKNADKSIVTAYRLEESLPAQTFKLRGLSSSAKYKIVSDGKDLGTMTGEALMDEGVSVNLESTWRAGVIELKSDAH
jgi:hypothetical protein